MMKNFIIVFTLLFTIQTYSQFDDLNSKFLLAQSYEQMGDLQKARILFEEVYFIQKDNFQFFESLNRVYLKLKLFNESIQIIQNRLSIFPNDITSIGLLGVTYYQAGKEEETFKLWNNALKEQPTNLIYYRILANYALELRLFDKAIDILQKGKANTAEARIFSYDLAHLYSLTMRFKEAAEEYIEIINFDPNQVIVIQSRILSYINKPEALVPTIQVFQKSNFKENSGLGHLLAALYVENNQFVEAFELLKLLDKKFSLNGQEVFQFATRMSGLNQYRLASNSFEYLLSEYPYSNMISNFRLNYAKNLEAELNYEFIKNNPTWKDFFTYTVFNKEKYNSVIENYKKIISTYQHSEIAIESILRIGEIYLNRLGNLEEAEKYFSEVIQKFSMSRYFVAAALNQIDIFIKKNNVEQASALISRLEINPIISLEDRNRIILYKAKINFYNGAFSEAKKYLDIISQQTQDKISNDAIELSLLISTSIVDSISLAKFARAEFEMEKENFAAAQKLFEELTGLNQLFILSSKSELRVVQCLIAVNNYSSAIEKIELSLQDSNKRFLENQKNIFSDHLQFLLGQIYQNGLVDFPKAIRAYEDLMIYFPNSLFIDKVRDEILKLKKIS